MIGSLGRRDEGECTGRGVITKESLGQIRYSTRKDGLVDLYGRLTVPACLQITARGARADICEGSCVYR